MVSITLLAKSIDAQSDILRQFQTRVEERTARVGVVGMGYVGLPIALLFAKKGFPTTGFDIDPAKIESLGRGNSYIKHIPEREIADEVEQGRFTPTTDFARLNDMDAIIICVPTPLDDHREPDLSFIRATTETISSHLRRGQLVVLESTTYPGTTEEVVLPILEKSGLRCPVSDYSAGARPHHEGAEAEFLLAFSPDREDPGNKNFKTFHVPKVVGGVNVASVLATQALYETAFERTVLVSSSRAAEMTKLLENTYIGKLEDYHYKNIEYLEEKIQDDRAQVTTLVVRNDVKLPVNYILQLTPRGWMVYDINIEGVSLVRNYMEQFRSILRTGSFEGLVKIIEAKNRSFDQAGKGS